MFIINKWIEKKQEKIKKYPPVLCEIESRKLELPMKNWKKTSSGNLRERHKVMPSARTFPGAPASHGTEPSGAAGSAPGALQDLSASSACPNPNWNPWELLDQPLDHTRISLQAQPAPILPGTPGRCCNPPSSHDFSKI